MKIKKAHEGEELLRDIGLIRIIIWNWLFDSLSSRFWEGTNAHFKKNVELIIVFFVLMMMREKIPVPTSENQAFQACKASVIYTSILFRKIWVGGLGWKCWNSGVMLSLRWLIANDLFPTSKHNTIKQDTFSCSLRTSLYVRRHLPH